MAGPRDQFMARPLQEAIVSNIRPSLLILAGAVCLVLLIASTNVANLLLVRATGRKREIAIRVALGANRSRIVRQLLTESVLLSVSGAALGLVLGMAGIRALLAINPGNIPRIGPHGELITMDWRVLAFTVFVALAYRLVVRTLPRPAVLAHRSEYFTEGKQRTFGHWRSFEQDPLAASHRGNRARFDSC